MSEKKLTYAGSGVNYDAMDPFKKLCQKAAITTAPNLKRYGLVEVPASRGESCYLMEAPDFFLGHVEEGLGTKNLIADAMFANVDKTYYDNIAQDTVAMIVNDLITVGALPFSVAMHLAVADSQWFECQKRVDDLIKGWVNACRLARCTWSGGETPTLKDVILPGAAMLGGSAVGVIGNKTNLIKGDIEPGDLIVIIYSNGVHANGLTLCRKIAGNLADGYLTKLPNGRTYGATLLDPTHIYVPIVAECQREKIKIKYAVNVTGHGWRKLMRHNGNFSYIIEEIPIPGPIFDFIQKNGPVDDQEAYGNFNMGAGFVLYVRPEDAPKVFKIARQQGMDALVAGHIEASPTKKVVIQPKNITFEAKSMDIR